MKANEAEGVGKEFLYTVGNEANMYLLDVDEETSVSLSTYKFLPNASYVPLSLSSHPLLFAVFSVNEIKMKLMSGVFSARSFFLKHEKKKKRNLCFKNKKKE